MADKGAYLIKRQRALADFGEFALRSDDLDAVLAEACRLVAEALGTGRAKVLEIEEDGRLFLRAGVGWDAGLVGNLRLALGEHSSESFSIAQGQPVITNDVEMEDRFDIPAFMKRAGVRAIANVPVFLPGSRAFGLLQVDATEPRDFGPEDTEFLRTYAAILGPVIDRLLKVRELSSAEERFRLVVEEARDHAIFMTDPEGRITDWLPGAAAVFGWGVEEAIGQPISILFTPEDREAGQDRWEIETARAEGVAPDVRWHVRKDGLRVFIQGSTRPLRDPGGALRGFLKIGQDVTEPHRADERLRESEERFRAIVETARDYAIFTLDPEGRIETWPPGAQEVFGWTAPEAVGQLVEVTFTPEDRAAGVPEQERREAQDTGQAKDIRWHMRKDGSRVFIEGMTRPLTGPEGALKGFVKVGQDVTQRRTAEEALRESEARFQAVVNSIDQMIWSTRPDGFHDFYNQRWYDYTGVPQGSSDGEGWAGLFHPDDRDRAWVIWRHSLRTGEPYHIEYRLRHRSGQYRWVLGRAQAMRDDAGRITRWFGTCTEIQDIVEAREVLARSREELAREVALRTAERDEVWRNSRDLMLVARFDTTVLAVNPAWTSILGWSEAELMGRHFVELIHPDDLTASLAEVERLSAEGRTTTQFENRYRRKDGEWVWLSWAISSHAGRFYGVARDVTADKARDAELEVAQEQLRQSQKMEAMGQLTGGVAHDFNNLLTPIIGSLDRLITRGVGSERERRLMSGALESAERAKTLVQRLLAFARRQPLQPVPVDVAVLVEGMADLMGSTLGPTIEVWVELADDLPPVKADPNQLEMALLNLAVNSRDAMPEGGRLTIAASRQSVRRAQRSGVGPGHYVRLSVTDTGVGMDAATRERAVEPFFSTKGIGRGTGLGLSMVHGLTAQLGGGLTIQSEPGQGTTVELWLPVSPEPAGVVEDGRAAPRHAQARGRALLVDDDHLVRMSTADMLADLGFDVLEAGSAEEALRLLHEGIAVDLLVTDHLMPGMSGVDLARGARALRPGLPVLIVSGYAEVGGLAPDLPRLVKPFRAAELAERVAAIEAARCG